MDMKIRTGNCICGAKETAGQFTRDDVVNIRQDGEAHVIEDASPAELHKQSLV